MTSFLAAIGLTFDGNDLQPSDGSLFLEITSGLNEPPEVRGVDVVVPASAGQIPRTRKPDRLTIVLTGYVQGIGADQDASRIAFRTVVDNVRGLFDTAADPADIVATMEDGSTRTNTARTMNVIWNEVIKSEFATVSVELLSVVPDWT